MTPYRQRLAVAFWTPCILLFIAGVAVGFVLGQRSHDKTNPTTAAAVHAEQIKALEAAARKHGIPLPPDWPK